MAMYGRVVALQQPAVGVVSGILLRSPNLQETLVITLAHFPEDIHDVSVLVARETWLPASYAGSVSLDVASKAFEALALRGWRCSRRSSKSVGSRIRLALGFESTFALIIFRITANFAEEHWTTESPSQLGGHLSLNGAESPRETWVGAPAVLVSAPFGSEAIGCCITRGVCCNVSEPGGLILLDLRRMENCVGGAVLLMNGDGRVPLVACATPALFSESGGICALSLAIPLATIGDALLSDKCCTKFLSHREAAMLNFRRPGGLEAGKRPVALESPRRHPTRFAPSVRRGVVLLWIPSTGSWASAVVISRCGYLVTCTHLLTGKSWMEDTPESAGKDTGFKPASPTHCRGRGMVRLPDGNHEEATFDVDVVLVHPGFLDAVVMRVRQKSASLVFEPMPWHEGPPPPSGTKVWVVGHGLFGPDSPFRRPTITEGHIAKVVSGNSAKRSGRPALVQSTAAVHSGCSGGALVDVNEGTFLGLVTTNVRQEGGSIMPHVNFSLPVELLLPIRQLPMTRAGPMAVEALRRQWEPCAANDAEQTLWRFVPEVMDLPSEMAARCRLALRRIDELVEEAREAEKAGLVRPEKSDTLSPLKSAL